MEKIERDLNLIYFKKNKKQKKNEIKKMKKCPVLHLHLWNLSDEILR